MRHTITAALVFTLALSALAADALKPQPKPLSKEQAQALEILQLKFERDTALLDKLNAQLRQYQTEYQAITQKACTDAGFKECTVANGMLTPKPVEAAKAEAEAKPQANQARK